MCRACAAVALLSVLLTAGCAGGHGAMAAPSRQLIRWEAEVGATVPPGRDAFNGQIYPKDQLYPEVLSGGNWLSNWSTDPQRKEAAEWTVHVPVKADYYLYARKFWYHGPFKWRFDHAGRWQEVYRTGLLDQQDLNPQTSVSWVGLGSAGRLTAGDHVFEIELLKDPKKYVGNDDWIEEGGASAAAFDCFALSTDPAFQQGNPNPATAQPLHDPDHWAFEPGTDALDPAASPIDLSFLNQDSPGHYVCRDVEAKLGSDSFKVDTNNDGVAETPVRFWGVCVGANAVYMDQNSMAYMAGKLAKAGVNLVRVHAPAFDWNLRDPMKLDKDYVARLRLFISAMKSRGIYTSLSIYYPRWFFTETLLPGASPANPHARPYGLIYTDNKLQNIYKQWVKRLLGKKTPQEPDNEGLGAEPALLEWEIVNDDHLFAWDVNPADKAQGALSKPLTEQYDVWLTRKYRSLDRARAAWGLQEKDAPQATLVEPWLLSREARPAGQAKPAQVVDQTNFLRDASAVFMKEMRKYIHDVSGSPAVAGSSTYWNPYGGPWDPYARYGDTMCEVMERLAYWPNPDNQPDQDRTTIKLGDAYTDEDPLTNAAQHPIREIQYPGHQHMVAEYSASMVNRYRTDSVYLASVYGATQGTDAICFFYMASPAWNHTLTKWPVMTPAVFGQFPAFALAYRRGDVREQDPAVKEVFNLADQPSVDALYRDREGKLRDDVCDPLSYYVGRVTREFTDDPNVPSSVTPQVQLGDYISADAKTVKTIDGHATLDYGRAVAWVNTESFQAVTGMLDKCGQALADVALTNVTGEYGCAAVISLGGRPTPIATAGMVLVQVMSEEKNYGWREMGAGGKKQVIAIGPGPLNVKDIYGTVTIHRPNDSATVNVIALGPNGYQMPNKQITPVRGRSTISFALEPDVMYYVLAAQRTAPR